MKILSNFNTNLDQEKIHEKSIVVKHYPMYLVSWWKLWIYAFFLMILFWFWYLQQSVFWYPLWTILNIIYFILIAIWLYYHSSFIFTYIKNFKTYYDINNKHLLEKHDIYYDKALKISLFLLIINIVLSIVSCFYGYFNDNIKFFDIVLYFITNITLIILQWAIIKKSLIDFEMDFMVIDWKAWEISIISQSGFFNIGNPTAQFHLISWVNSQSKGIIRSWLDYWFIDIITMSNDPNMSIKYIKNPWQIASIIKMAKSVYLWEDKNLEKSDDFTKDQ